MLIMEAPILDVGLLERCCSTLGTRSRFPASGRGDPFSVTHLVTIPYMCWQEQGLAAELSWYIAENLEAQAHQAMSSKVHDDLTSTLT